MLLSATLVFPPVLSPLFSSAPYLVSRRVYVPQCDQWVNYFLHSGHVHIDGLKVCSIRCPQCQHLTESWAAQMSRSLKNFIMISEILRDYSARQVRLSFLLQRYNKPMTYSDKFMVHAIALDKKFTEFFLNMKATVRWLVCHLSLVIMRACGCICTAASRPGCRRTAKVG